MSVANLVKQPPATPEADALAELKRLYAEKLARMQTVAGQDTQDSQIVNEWQTAVNDKTALQERRIDFMAMPEPSAADLSAIEHEITVATEKVARLAEPAKVATRRRVKHLRPELEALRAQIDALPEPIRRAKRNTALERQLALGPEHARKQAAFLLDTFVELAALGLVADRQGVVGLGAQPLGSKSVIADLNIPLPGLKELQAFAPDRKALFAAVEARAVTLEAELSK